MAESVQSQCVWRYLGRPLALRGRVPEVAQSHAAATGTGWVVLLIGHLGIWVVLGVRAWGCPSCPQIFCCCLRR